MIENARARINAAVTRHRNQQCVATKLAISAQEPMLFGPFSALNLRTIAAFIVPRHSDLPDSGVNSDYDEFAGFFAPVLMTMSLIS